MNVTTERQRHEAALARVAEEYRRRGYDVAIEPSDASIPEFLRPHRPDLLATKGDEKVVVEVARASARRTRGFWSTLAERVPRERGWHLRIVAVEDEGAAPASRLLPTADEIRRTLAETEALLEQGHAAPALLLAWSLFEAAARLRMMDDDRDPASPSTPASLVKSLIHFGYVDQEEAEPLEAAMRLRNETAHGFIGAPASGEAVRAVLAAIQRLLGPGAAEAATGARGDEKVPARDVSGRA